MRADIAIVGGGIVGLSVARQLLLSTSGRVRVVVLEKEADVALHQSKRNSGVIHSGIYYKPGSMRASLCVEGARDMYAYCQQKGIATDRCGKLIVATEGAEVERLRALYERGVQNGVEGLCLIDRTRIKQLEPLVDGFEAIHSPNTGIVDYHVVAKSFAADVVALGGTVLTNTPVTGVARSATELALLSHNNRIAVSPRYVINAAGLYADRVAQLFGGSTYPKLVPVRGDFMALIDGRDFRSMVYPVPNPAFPFLGTHITRKLTGEVVLGPNAVIALSREGYTWTDINARDCLEAATHVGFLKLALRNWRWCLGELRSGLQTSAFVSAVQRFMPGLRTEQVVHSRHSGVRALAVSNSGEIIEDFVLELHETDSRFLSIRNAPSPAATSSLAIARVVADECLGVFPNL